MSEHLPLITRAHEMPVCLHGDRLTFTTDCLVACQISETAMLERIEQAGSSYDGASIPRLFWSLIGHPLEEQFRWASFWHDRLCEESSTWAGRRFADATLLVLLDREKVAYWRRTAMWIAVRLYAWGIWSWRRRR